MTLQGGPLTAGDSRLGLIIFGNSWNVAGVVSGNASNNRSLTNTPRLARDSPLTLQGISGERLDMETWNSKPPGSWQKQVRGK